MRRFALIQIAAALSALAAVAPARAERVGPCIPGTTTKPICSVRYGQVTYVDDGDTLDVSIEGLGRRRVRVTGIQAMEQSTYPAKARLRRGECHAVEASALVDHLRKLSKGRVRLSAQDPTSSSRGRLRRSVAFLIRGHWRDLGSYLIARGAALWFPNLVEYAWNTYYGTLSEQAAAGHVGLFDTTYCGAGPDDDVPIKLWVNWDADGDDAVDPEGEWIAIRNESATRTLSLGGWWVRDSDLRRYRLPDSAVIAPGGLIRVHVGTGTATDTDFYWGLAFPAFENATYGPRGLGDGAYLFDPQGDLRAWMIYPCRYQCSNPLQDALTISAQPRGQEYVDVANVSSFPVDLEGYELTSAPHGYAFGPDSVLQPGETMRVDVLGSAADDTRLEKHMDAGDPILRDTRGAVQIRTFDDIVVTCASWGGAGCDGPRSLR